jgi:hypothetical protein
MAMEPFPFACDVEVDPVIDIAMAMEPLPFAVAVAVPFTTVIRPEELPNATAE